MASKILVRGLPLVGLALMAGAALGAAPARAGDDGAAPIWMGFGNVLGIVKNQNDDIDIDYHDRGKLVLPPKTMLPRPGATAAGANPAWPQDSDLQKAKKAKLEEKKSNFNFIGRPRDITVTPGSQVTMSATAGQGPGSDCKKPDPQTGECPQKPGAQWNLNPLTWVGIQKKPPVILGPEPDRENLTDPPKGLRAPVEGVGAVADN